MADYGIPQDIILTVFTHLSVKKLLYFRSLNKPWCKILTAPEFIKTHLDQFSKDPSNDTFIIYRCDDRTMSLFNIEKNPEKLDHPYPETFFRMDFVGCINGLLCMGCPPLGQGIVLWNPALRLSKFVRLSTVAFGIPEKVSLGFGYDANGDDFKVVRIVCLDGKKMRNGLEVYSTKTDSWKIIKAGFKFRVLRTKNNAIVNGNPYWVAKVNETGSDFGDVLVWFDVSKLVFGIVPLAMLKLEKGAHVPFVDWKGSLGAIVCSKNKERVESVDVWVFDDGEMIWSLKHTFGPIEMCNVKRFVQCSKNGKIMGECVDGKLFVFDSNTGCVKYVEIDGARKSSFEVVGYHESLMYIEGMKPVVVKKEEDRDEDEDDTVVG